MLWQYTPEVIKAKGEVSEEVLVGFCNWIWNEEKVFEEWNKGVLIKLQKKGNLSHSKSWPGIINMLVNMASKVF